MAKDPAFLFYTSDFLTGTMFMTYEQTGKYIKLLCAQHQHNGRIDKSSFLLITGDDSFLKSKFKEDEKGFFNERLEQEISKRNEKSKKMSANAMQKHSKSNAIAMQTENANENVNEDVNKDESNKKRYEVFFSQCLEAEIWKTELCKATGAELLKIPELLKEFNSHLISGGEVHGTLKDYQKHFRNWLLQRKSFDKKLQPQERKIPEVIFFKDLKK